MHKWFKDRCFVWEINGVRWYSNGHVLLSQTAVDLAARNLRNGFAKMATDLKYLPPGRYENEKRFGDCDPSMVSGILAQIGDIRPIEDTRWLVRRENHEKEMRVLRVKDTEVLVTLEAGYGALVEIAEALVSRYNADAREHADPIGLWIGDECHGLIMPMRADGLKIVRLGTLRKPEGDALALSL